MVCVHDRSLRRRRFCQATMFALPSSFSPFGPRQSVGLPAKPANVTFM
jgi:hypothetical protein